MVGGGEIYISNLMQNMPEFRHLVISNVYLPKSDIEHYRKFERKILYSTPPFVTTPRFVNFPVNIISALVRLRNKKHIYEKVKPDLNVIHGISIFGTLERLYFSLGVNLIDYDYFQDIEPKVLTVHNLYSPIALKHVKRQANYEDRLFARFRTYICVDINIYEFLKNKFKSKDIYFIPNSIPDTFFDNTAGDKKYKPSSPRLGFVARYQYDKGVHILKEMVEMSPKSFKFIQVFSATPKQKQTVIDEYRSYDNVELHFNIPNKLLPRYYRKMDLLFNPVIGEGISRVSLEGMAGGVVPLMRDTGNRYPVEDRKTGLLFNEDNLPDIIDRVRSLTPAEYRELQANARHILQKKFSNSNVVPQLIDVYTKTMLEDR